MSTLTYVTPAVKQTEKTNNQEIRQEKWSKVLKQLDDIVMIESNLMTDVIIISLPYKLNDIQNTINNYLFKTFDNTLSKLMLFSFDIIIDFLIPNKKFIANKLGLKLTTNNNKEEEKSNDNDHNDDKKWTATQHDK